MEPPRNEVDGCESICFMIHTNQYTNTWYGSLNLLDQLFTVANLSLCTADAAGDVVLPRHIRCY